MDNTHVRPGAQALKIWGKYKELPLFQQAGVMTYRTCFLRHGRRAGQVREGLGVLKGIWFITDGEVWGCLCVREFALSHDMGAAGQEGSHLPFRDAS